MACQEGPYIVAENADLTKRLHRALRCSIDFDGFLMSAAYIALLIEGHRSLVLTSTPGSLYYGISVDYTNAAIQC